MASLNKVQLIGRLGREPETKTTPKGTAYSRFAVAVDRVWKDKKDTDWFNVEAWGKLGEICSKYLKKGQLVYIEGALRTTRYDHEGETRYFTKVVASRMQMLEWREAGEEPVVAEETEIAEDQGEYKT